MDFGQKIFHNKKYILASALFIALLFIISFKGFESGVNSSVRSYLNNFLSAKGDTNIVIVEITDNDINKLGWPLKRNYYALLVNKANRLGVTAIGLEVFLSPELSSQEIYTDLLIAEAKKKNNVVFGSVIQKNNRDEISVLYPSPKVKNEEILTGHLNYNDEHEIKIPLQISNEKAFSEELFYLVSGKESIAREIYINPKFKFENFRKISLIKFLTKDKFEFSLNEKILLVGVTAETLAKYINTSPTTKMPGIGIHAFALTNLIHNNFLRTDFHWASALLALLIMFSLIWGGKEKELWISFILLFIIYSACYAGLDYSMNFAFLLLGYFSVELVSKSLEFFSSRRNLESIAKESEILKSQLRLKEEKLKSLQTMLENKGKENEVELKTEIEKLKSEIEELKSRKSDEEPMIIPDGNVKNFEGIIYVGQAMEKVVNLIKKVADTETTVLIMGESGAGKELVAKALHNLSRRKEKNFLAVNCAALTESLLESELFGHVKGAFTNAIEDKTGLFEAAKDGTIFLDEIGEISPSFQSKLLRVLQNGEYHKVGSSEVAFTNARIIAATNKNLEEAVKSGQFREDLFYRLNVINIHLPPLRERKEDIIPLAKHFLKAYSPKLELSKGVAAQLEKAEWKGNVRQLESVIKRAAIFADSEKRDIIHLGDLPEELRRGVKDSIEEIILDSLREKSFSHSSINETAQELGNISRTLVSENLRGLFFKFFVENDFNEITAIKLLSASDDTEINSKLKSKTGKYLQNIEKDVKKFTGEDFEYVKSKLNSKYKNLPRRYHTYLDEIIKYYLNSNT